MCSNCPTLRTIRNERLPCRHILPGRALWRILGAAAMLVTAGCGTGGAVAPTAASAAPPATAPATAPVAAGAVEVALVDHEGLLAAIAAHRGKVVVLDCWGTSCPPCVKEFPRLVALAAAHPDDVACLSLSFDYEGIGTPEEVLPPVRDFLTRVGAGRVGNMLTREDADAMYRKLELDSVPAVYVYGPDGMLARRFDDDDATKRLGRPFTYDDVAETVRDLLNR